MLPLALLVLLVAPVLRLIILLFFLFFLSLFPTSLRRLRAKGLPGVVGVRTLSRDDVVDLEVLILLSLLLLPDLLPPGPKGLRFWFLLPDEAEEKDCFNCRELVCAALTLSGVLCLFLELGVDRLLRLTLLLADLLFGHCLSLEDSEEIPEEGLCEEDEDGEGTNLSCDHDCAITVFGEEGPSKPFFRERPRLLAPLPRGPPPPRPLRPPRPPRPPCPPRPLLRPPRPPRAGEARSSCRK